MGGKSSSRGISSGEVRRLEEVAREALHTDTASGKRNVFISFAHEDMDEVNMLRAQAKNEKSDIEFNDWSVREPFDSKKADYIKQQIRERIRQSSVTVVYVSANAASSKWVDWEIRESIKLGKGVIAVHKGDRAPSSLPPAIKEHGVTVIPWNQERLSAEIERASKKRS